MLRLYEMDIELLFSTNPFAGHASAGDTTFITRPNHEFEVNLRPSSGDGATSSTSAVPHETIFNLPEALRHTNLLVEVVSGALRRLTSHFATRMKVSVRRNYGQLKVVDAASGKPLSRVYVKAYFRTQPRDKGTFYKDGHTDIRGVFDYVALNTDQLSRTERFALLVMSDTHGSVIVQTPPPVKR